MKLLDSGIRANAEVVIVSTKGEAVAIAIAVMNSDFYSTNTHGVVAKVKRVIMDRNMYTKKWGNGPYSAMKRQLKEKGELDVSHMNPFDLYRIFYVCLCILTCP